MHLFVSFQAQSDDDADVGPDDVAVNVEGRDGFMDAFFAEVSNYYLIQYWPKQCTHRRDISRDSRHYELTSMKHLILRHAHNLSDRLKNTEFVCGNRAV